MRRGARPDVGVSGEHGVRPVRKSGRRKGGGGGGSGCSDNMTGLHACLTFGPEGALLYMGGNSQDALTVV